MTISSDFKVLRERKLDKETTLTVFKNLMSGLIFVEFACTSPRLTLQKNFQDSLDGKRKSQEFAKTIKNTKDLKKYFGI